MRLEGMVKTEKGCMYVVVWSPLAAEAQWGGTWAIPGFKEANILFLSSDPYRCLTSWGSRGEGGGGVFVAIAAQRCSPRWEAYPHLYWHPRHGVLGCHWLARDCPQRRLSHADINLLGAHRTQVSSSQSPKKCVPNDWNHSAGELVARDLSSWSIAWWYSFVRWLDKFAICPQNSSS